MDVLEFVFGMVTGGYLVVLGNYIAFHLHVRLLRPLLDVDKDLVKFIGEILDAIRGATKK